MNKYYTGVGSRKTPTNILKIMEAVARKLASEGWVLRSGGALGADRAFEKGSSQKEIFYAQDANFESKSVAKKFHPAWDRLSEYVKKLHARNAFQVLGRDLKSPSGFLLCWTPDGAISHNERTIKTGGTGTAISIASANNIPVFNLHRKDHLERVAKWLCIEMPSTGEEELYQVDTGYACFGLVVVSGLVTRTAPISKYSLGRKIEEVISYYKNAKNASVIKL